MNGNSYALRTTVSFMESALDGCGQLSLARVPESWTREELRRRYRKLIRVFKRLASEQGQETEPAPENYFWLDLKPPSDNIFIQGSAALQTRIGPMDSEAYDFPFDVDSVSVLWRPAPCLAGTHMTRMSAALLLGRNGVLSVLESAMAWWSRRHDIVPKPPSPDKQPRRRRATDRLYLALMRFVFGFFGNHKVDARNNP